jgi:L-rhamnose-H+ transport protein
MSNTILLALFLCVLAGFLNGSYAIPIKCMDKWKEENLWLVFFIFSFLILPWLTIFIMVPNVLEIFKLLPMNAVLGAIIGGVVFGFGMLFFANAFKYIGIGLNFVVNISIGTAGAALVPILWHPEIIVSTYSIIQLIGIVFFIIAVVLGAKAGDIRSKTQGSSEGISVQKRYLLLGVCFAILGGIGSACQGISYTYSNPFISSIAMSKFNVSPISSGIISWVIIFTAATIPYAIYFLIKNIKNRSFKYYRAPGTGIYWLYIVYMGIASWGSLIIFSKASADIGGDLAPTIAWPMFMVFIVLTSNFWGIVFKEWKNAHKKALLFLALSLLLYIGAIVTFSYSSVIKPPTTHQSTKIISK